MTRRVLLAILFLAVAAWAPAEIVVAIVQGQANLDNTTRRETPNSWHCGACGWVDEKIEGCKENIYPECPTPHRWRSDVVAAQYQKDWALQEQRLKDEAQRKKDLASSQFIITAGAESYELDICLDHGELRIRRKP